MALPAGLTPKTVTFGLGSFFDGTLVDGTVMITAPVNVLHQPTGSPLFSSAMSKKLVAGEATFDLCPTDHPDLNRVDWTYKLTVKINGALVQPDPINFTLPVAGPDTVDLDALVSVPSSAGTPVSVSVLTAQDLDPLTAGYVADSTSATSVQLRAAFGSPVYVDRFGADPTGATDSTAAIKAAVASLPTVTVYATPPSGGTSATYHYGTLRFSAGTYKIGSTSDIGNLGPFISLIGEGHNATKLDYRGAGDALRVFCAIRPSSDTFDTLSAFAGAIDRLTIDGTNSQAGANGLHYGDLEGGVLGSDLWITNFTGAGSVGLLFDNSVSWTENIYGRVCTRNCTTGVMFKVTTGDVSFMYNDLTLKVYAWPNQDGVSFQGGPDYSSGFLHIKANCLRSTTANTGSLIVIGARTNNHSTRLVNTRFDIQGETNGGTQAGTNAHKSMNFVDGNFQFLQSTGIWAFGGFAASNAPGVLDYAGFITGDASLYNTVPSGVLPRNLLTQNQSTAATDTTGASSPTNATIGRDTTVVPQYGADVASYTMTSVASGDMSFKVPAVTAAAGGLIAASAYVLPAAGTPRQGRVEVDWLTSANGYISTSRGPTITQNANSWTQFTLMTTAPATAAKAQIKVWVFATGGAAELHYVSRISIGRIG